MSQQRVGLNHLTSMYKAAETVDQYAAIADGVYRAKIAHAEVKRAQNGNPYIAWRLNVAINSEEFIPIQKMSFLTEGFALSRLKADMKAVGIDPDILIPLDRLHDVLVYLIGAVVEFEQQTRENKNDLSRPYVNNYFIRLLRESGKQFPVFQDDQMNDFAEMSKEEDDELPF